MPGPAKPRPHPDRPATPREQAVALAYHLRETEGLTIREIAARLGRGRSVVAGYFSDPTGEKAKRYKAKHRGRCQRCGTPTAAAPGTRLCWHCFTATHQRQWTRQTVLEAMLAWHDAYDRLPTSYDWNATAAAKRSPEALKRLHDGDWPGSSSVTTAYGSWPAATRAGRRQLAKRQRS